MIIYRCESKESSQCEGDVESRNGEVPDGWESTYWEIQGKNGERVGNILAHWCGPCELKRLEKELGGRSDEAK